MTSCAPPSPGGWRIPTGMAGRASFDRSADPADPNAGRASSGHALLWAVPLLCLPLLLWPAIWNGYPIVFADTGTYLTQAIHHYLGWDRPPFYSLFMVPWHQGTATWPVVMVQSCLTVWVLDLTRRGFGLGPVWLLGLVLFLGAGSWLPWMVSELMPDLFTPLLVLLLTLQVFIPARYGALERAGMFLLTTVMITAQTSSNLVTHALLAVMDAAALVLAVDPVGAPTEARMCVRMGFTALRDIAQATGLPFDPDPDPDDPVALPEEAFAEVVRQLAAVGYPMSRPVDEAWAHFRGWRVNYESVAYALTYRLDAPPAPWSGPRRRFRGETMEPDRPTDRQPSGAPAGPGQIARRPSPAPDPGTS